MNDSPHKAAVNNGPWQSFPNREKAVAWVRRQCNRPTDVGWVHPADAFDADGAFVSVLSGTLTPEATEFLRDKLAPR